MRMTVARAAVLAGVEPATIRQWIARKHLRSSRALVLAEDGKVRSMIVVDERELLVAEQATRSRGGVHR